MTKSFFVVAVLGLALTTFSGIGHATNCQDLLANNIYRCQVIADYGVRPDDCFRFNSATPTVSQDFDLYVDNQGSSLGCSCKTTGNFKSPTFDASKEWLCVSPDSGLVWGGKVAGKGKISKVIAVNQSGGSFIFNCVVDPSCTTSVSTIGTLTGEDTQSPYEHD